MALEGWTRAGRRAGVTPAEAVALAALLLASACLTVIVWQRGTGGAPGPAISAAPLIQITDAPMQSPAATVVVDVVGLVEWPGVVELPEGARVADAIRAAGGVRSPADTSPLNLARQLADGEQVVVTDGSAPQPAAAGTVASGFAADGRLDLNRATLADLETLPGVGPVTAERIVGHREAIGGFTDVVQLLEVSGIGPARYASLEPLVTV